MPLQTHRYKHCMLFSTVLIIFQFNFSTTCSAQLLEKASLYETLFGFSYNKGSKLFFAIDTKRNIQISKDVVAINQNEKIYVDIAKLVEVLGFAILSGKNSFKGWFRTENNSFYLDLVSLVSMSI